MGRDTHVWHVVIDLAIIIIGDNRICWCIYEALFTIDFVCGVFATWRSRLYKNDSKGEEVAVHYLSNRIENPI